MFASIGEIFFDGVALARRNEWPELGFGFGWIAHHKFFGGGGKFVDEWFVNAALDKKPAAGATILAGVSKDAHRGSIGSFLPVGIGEDDVGRLATKFERNAFYVAGGEFHDARPDGS